MGMTEDLVAEQIAYYDAVAVSYEQWANKSATAELGQVTAALQKMVPHGDVLELACGSGLWTEWLAKAAVHVTAVDASPRMLERLRRRITAHNVEVVLADVFEWEPSRRYDAVTFAFWHSHVPPDWWEVFWEKVDRALAPAGRVLFMDNAPPRRPSSFEVRLDDATALRRDDDGRPYRIVKIYHLPAQLERRLRGLGWDLRILVSGRVLWGYGGRAGGA